MAAGPEFFQGTEGSPHGDDEGLTNAVASSVHLSPDCSPTSPEIIRRPHSDMLIGSLAVNRGDPDDPHDLGTYLEIEGPSRQPSFINVPTIEHTDYTVSVVQLRLGHPDREHPEETELPIIAQRQVLIERLFTDGAGAFEAGRRILTLRAQIAQEADAYLEPEVPRVIEEYSDGRVRGIEALPLPAGSQSVLSQFIEVQATDDGSEFPEHTLPPNRRISMKPLSYDASVVTVSLEPMNTTTDGVHLTVRPLFLGRRFLNAEQALKKSKVIHAAEVARAQQPQPPITP